MGGGLHIYWFPSHINVKLTCSEGIGVFYAEEANIGGLIYVAYRQVLNLQLKGTNSYTWKVTKTEARLTFFLNDSL